MFGRATIRLALAHILVFDCLAFSVDSMFRLKDVHRTASVDIALIYKRHVSPSSYCKARYTQLLHHNISRKWYTTAAWHDVSRMPFVCEVARAAKLE